MTSTPSNDPTKVDGGWLTADRTVKITESDIAHGRVRDQYACAIVRAIQRQYPDAVRVRVNAKYVGFSIGELRYTYPTPKEAIDAVIKPFDQGGKAEPMTLRLKGGKMKDVIHSDERALEARRNDKRDKKGREVSERQAQMSPHYSEFERF